MIDLLTGLVWVFLSVANPLFGSVPKGSQKEAGDFAGPLIWGRPVASWHSWTPSPDAPVEPPAPSSHCVHPLCIAPEDSMSLDGSTFFAHAPLEVMPRSGRAASGVRNGQLKHLHSPQTR